MKKLFLFYLCLITITCYSQKKDKREGAYSAYLYSVEVSEKSLVGKIDSSTSLYEDSIIKIKWDYSYSQMSFKLKNKSEQTLKIIWDDAVYISITNETDKVFHDGIKYIDKENSQPPTSIYKNTILSDLIAPVSYSYFVSGQYGGWRSNPLIPVPINVWSKKIEYIKDFLGLTIRVILPIKIEDKTIEYTFNFRTEFIEKKIE
jgi:hypothetical protein